MKKRFLSLSFLLLMTGQLMLVGQSCSAKKDDINNEIKPEEDKEENYGKIDDLMPLAQGQTASATTVMGRHFEKLKTTTEADRLWLNDPTKEPSLPAGKENSLELRAFPVELYPYKSPMKADCNQRELGNCSAIAVFAELAYINPAFIQSIIKDNGNQTYTLKMFDPQGKEIAVTISNKFMASKGGGKLAGVNGKKGQATWVTVMEKALMKYIDVYKLVNTVEGIGSEFASPPFTGDGSSFAFYAGRLNGESLKRVVETSLAEGKIVIGGFTTPDVKVGFSKTVNAHAWSFSYAPKMAINGYMPLFVMRNPWGNDNGKDRDGQMFIPKDDKINGLIDLRIINAGAAKPSKRPGVYAAPVY